MQILTAIFHTVFAGIAILPTLLHYVILKIVSPKSFNNPRTKRVEDKGIFHPPVKGVHHEFILCEDVRIHVARAGMDVSKKLIFFLHGFPEFWYSWRAQIEALQDDYEVAAIDLPGYNASGKPERTSHYITQDICRIIAGALTGLCRESCILVGHDWGGAIAGDFAAMYPRKVEKLAILAAPPGNLLMRNMDLHQLMSSMYMWQMLVPGIMERMLATNDWAIIRTIFTQRAYGGLMQSSMSEEDIERYQDAIAVKGALHSALNYYRAALWHTGVMDRNKEVKFGWKLNPQLRMPLLLLWGDSDFALTPNLLRGIGRKASNATVRVMPGCSHWVQQDCPEEVNRLLRMFIESERSVL